MESKGYFLLQLHHCTYDGDLIITGDPQGGGLVTMDNPIAATSVKNEMKKIEVMKTIHK